MAKMVGKKFFRFFDKLLDDRYYCDRRHHFRRSGNRIHKTESFTRFHTRLGKNKNNFTLRKLFNQQLNRIDDFGDAFYPTVEV